MMNPPTVLETESEEFKMNKNRLKWAVVLYGIVMWAAGFILAAMVI
jgi:hypothetical protein